MQKRSRKSLRKAWLILPILLTLSLLFVSRASAYGNEPYVDGKIYLDPSSTRWTTLTHVVGDTFTLEVRITNVTECYGIVFTLQWDDTVLNLTDCVKGTVLEGGGITTTFLIGSLPPSAGGDPYNPNNLLGEATYFRMASVHGVNIQPPSSGLVSTLTFKAVGEPPAGSPIDISVSFVDSADWATIWVTSPIATGMPVSTYYDYEIRSPSDFYFEGIYTTTTQIIADSQTFYVAIQSNSSTTAPVFDKTDGGGLLTFNATGDTGTAGFSNVTIPKTLMWINGESWLIRVDTVDVTSSCTITANATHTFIYIPYSHSLKPVDIVSPYAVPEFSVVALVPIFAVILFAALLTRRLSWRKRRSLQV